MKSARIVAFTAVAIVGCGAASTPKGTGLVPYAEWCDIVCGRFSSRTADTCGANLVDKASCAATCEGGRGSTASHRTYDEAGACTTYLDSLGCEQLGFALGQGLVGQGEFAARCGAR